MLKDIPLLMFFLLLPFPLLPSFLFSVFLFNYYFSPLFLSCFLLGIYFFLFPVFPIPLCLSHFSFKLNVLLSSSAYAILQPSFNLFATEPSVYTLHFTPFFSTLSDHLLFFSIYLTLLHSNLSLPCLEMWHSFMTK
jgi:hypothetical protein